jgi:hypothetical protein
MLRKKGKWSGPAGTRTKRRGRLGLPPVRKKNKASWAQSGERKEGWLGRPGRMGPQGQNYFSISNSFIIPRFESNLNRIQIRTKFYSNLKLKHSIKSK